MSERRWWLVASIAALCAVVLVRVLGPSDLWDQTQPRTIAYTIDIVAHGGEHWVLPREPDGHGATKPPLFNWLAVPSVAIFGPVSDLAHKVPSVVALLLLWLMVVVVGNRLDGSRRMLGSIAGIALACCYPMFKLGYLARPDMVLTLLLDVGWLSATMVLLFPLQGGRRRWLIAAFWIAAAGALLAKGPPVVALMLAVPAMARWGGTSWSESARLRWWIGVPVVLLVAASWIVGVWWIDAGHLRDELWFNEIYGRVTGTGPEGSVRGTVDLLLGLFHTPFYAVVRFLPWSIVAIAGIGALWRADRQRPLIRLLRSGCIFSVVIILFFSLSAGKRADYIASIYAPASLLVAWTLLQAPWWRRIGRVAVPVAAIGVLVAMAVTNARQSSAPSPMFGPGLSRFANHIDQMIEDEPLYLVRLGGTHLPEILGGGTDRRASMGEIAGMPLNRLFIASGEAGSMAELPAEMGVNWQVRLLMEERLMPDDVESSRPRWVRLYEAVRP